MNDPPCLRRMPCSRRLFGALLLARISQEVPFEAVDQEFNLKLNGYYNDLKNLKVGTASSSPSSSPSFPWAGRDVHSGQAIAVEPASQAGSHLRFFPLAHGRASLSSTPASPSVPCARAAGGGGALCRRMRGPGRALWTRLRTPRARHQVCRGEPYPAAGGCACQGRPAPPPAREMPARRPGNERGGSPGPLHTCRL